MNTSERFEQLIAFLTSHLPEPVEQVPDEEGGIVFTGGFPGEVVAHLTESSVVIIVTSAHRKVAFEACHYAIDRLKRIVPIWKKEFFEDGEVWVEGEFSGQ